MTITLKDVGSGFKRTALKENFDAIEAELNNNVLRRDGVDGANQLEVDIDVNSQRLLNLVDAINGREPVTLDQLNGALSAASGGLIAAQQEQQTGAQVVGGVTTFTGITYTVSSNNLYVFRNGNYQTKGVDYNETSTSSITWTTVPNATDALVFITNLATTNSTTDTAAITHTESGTAYNLATYLQNRDVVNVLDYGVDPTGATDNTAEWVLAEAAAAGKTLIVPKGTYLKNRTFPQSNTTYWFEPGVVVNGTTGGNNTWRVANVENVHFYFNGATINRDSSGTSANFYFSEAVGCSINDGNFVSGGAAKDCIYIGGSAVGTISRNIVVRGGSCKGALRNGISVVSALDTLIEGVEIYDTVGSPGAGVDIEANSFDTCAGTTIRNCVIHDNLTNGIGCVFGEQADIYDNYIYNNGNSGVGTAAGGTQFNKISWGDGTDVARAKDFRGISGFATATGSISANAASVGNSNKLKVGDIVIFSTKNGATIPVELQSQVRWTVTEISSAGNHDFKVGTANEYGEVTSFSGAGTGTMNIDADLSDVAVTCYSQEGQNSNFNIYNNVFRNNGGTGNPDISVSTGLNTSVYNNTIYSNLDKSLSVRFQYSVNVSAYNNIIYCDQASTAQTVGISFGQCTNIKTDGNTIYEATGEGITVSGCSRATLGRDKIVNCGRVSNRAYRLQNGSGAIVSPIIVQDSKNTPTNGIVLENTTSNCVVQNANCKTAGSSNANSILDSGTGNLVINSIVNDGTFR